MHKNETKKDKKSYDVVLGMYSTLEKLKNMLAFGLFP